MNLRLRSSRRRRPRLQWRPFERALYVPPLRREALIARGTITPASDPLGPEPPEPEPEPEPEPAPPEPPPPSALSVAAAELGVSVAQLLRELYVQAERLVEADAAIVVRRREWFFILEEVGRDMIAWRVERAPRSALAPAAPAAPTAPAPKKSKRRKRGRRG